MSCQVFSSFLFFLLFSDLPSSFPSQPFCSFFSLQIHKLKPCRLTHFLPPDKCYINCLSHFSWFVHPNSIQERVNIMKLLITPIYFPPASCYIVPLTASHYCTQTSSIHYSSIKETILFMLKKQNLGAMKMWKISRTVLCTATVMAVYLKQFGEAISVRMLFYKPARPCGVHTFLLPWQLSTQNHHANWLVSFLRPLPAAPASRSARNPPHTRQDIVIWVRSLRFPAPGVKRIGGTNGRRAWLWWTRIKRGNTCTCCLAFSVLPT
jgi:hypothetical protein